MKLVNQVQLKLFFRAANSVKFVLSFQFFVQNVTPGFLNGIRMNLKILLLFIALRARNVERNIFFWEFIAFRLDDSGCYYYCYCLSTAFGSDQKRLHLSCLVMTIFEKEKNRDFIQKCKHLAYPTTVPLITALFVFSKTFLIFQ